MGLQAIYSVITPLGVLASQCTPRNVAIACAIGIIHSQPSSAYPLQSMLDGLLDRTSKNNFSGAANFAIRMGANGQAAIKSAVANRDVGLVNTLMAAGVDPSRAAPGENTLLHNAVDAGDVEMVKALIKGGAKVDAVGKWEYTPLHRAVHKKNTQILAELLTEGADVNRVAEMGRTALHGAVALGYFEGVDLLIKAGAGIDAQEHDGNTSLSELVGRLRKDDHGKYKPLVKLFQNLIASGADVSVSNLYGSTALHRAFPMLTRETCYHKNRGSATARINWSYCVSPTPAKLELVEPLLQAGVDVNAVNENGNTALHRAVFSSENLHIIQALTGANAKLDIQNKDGFTALHIASLLLDDPEVVQTLLDAGANPNVISERVGTAAHIAVRMGFHQTLKCLIGAEANLDLPDREGNTALHQAFSPLLKRDCEFEHGVFRHQTAETGYCANLKPADPQSVRAILNAGASVNALNERGDTPLHYAVLSSKNLAPVLDLIHSGSDVNIPNRDGYTPLHIAAFVLGEEEVVKALIEAGADKTVQCKKGHTPLDLAKKYGMQHLESILEFPKEESV